MVSKRDDRPLGDDDIVGMTDEPVFGTDERGRIVMWNEAAERLLGYKASEVLGRPCRQIIGGEDLFGDDRNLREMIRRRQPARRFELEATTTSGRRVRVAVSPFVALTSRSTTDTVLLHLLHPVRADHASAVAGFRSADPVSASSTASAELARLLTPREMEVLGMLTRGSTNKRIADRLCISVATVRTHIQNICRKLRVHSKLEAVSLALRTGYHV